MNAFSPQHIPTLRTRFAPLRTRFAAEIQRRFPPEELRTAFVVALSLCLAYGLAFYWQLDKPFWAGFTVMILAGLPTVGQSLQKALLRTGGTIIGASMALLCIAALHQHHILLLLAVSLYLSLCVHLMSGNPNLRYFYFISGIVCLIIVIMSLNDPRSAFMLAVNRTEETLLGIASHTVVSLLFMQPSSRGLLLHSLNDICTRHGTLAAARPHTEADVRAAFGVWTELGALAERAHLLLPAVALESPVDYTRRRAWQAALHLSKELAEVQRRWIGSLLAVNDLAPGLFPDLDARLVTLEQAATALTGPSTHPSTQPSAVTPDLIPDATLLHSLSPAEQELARNLCLRYTRQLDLLRQLHDLVQHLTHNAPAPALPTFPPSPGLMASFTAERLRAPLQSFIQFWIIILLWVELNPPGLTTLTFVEMTLLLGLICLFAGNISPAVLFKPFLMGLGIMGGLFFFVYPRLTSAEGFLLLMFLYAFALCAIFAKPSQSLARHGYLLPWLAIGHFGNMPIYSVEAYFSGGVIFILGLVVTTTIHFLLFARDTRRDFWNARQTYFQALWSAMRTRGKPQQLALHALERSLARIHTLVTHAEGIAGIPAEAAHMLAAELEDTHADMRRAAPFFAAVTPDSIAFPAELPTDTIRAMAAACRDYATLLLAQNASLAQQTPPDQTKQFAQTAISTQAALPVETPLKDLSPQHAAPVGDIIKSLQHSDTLMATFPGRLSGHIPEPTPNSGTGGAYAS